MLAWLTDNLGTIVITLILIAVVAAIVISMINDRKKGKTSCGCGGDCAHCGACHKH
ncbi:MAG: FeoB-associated Cys-rich membrane protein [Oscillospiraceae bacterium]|nr:FeoB-associated Cys-rich membrane protein [Oscillospiraceae bacterium]